MRANATNTTILDHGDSTHLSLVTGCGLQNGTVILVTGGQARAAHFLDSTLLGEAEEPCIRGSSEEPQGAGLNRL